MQDRKVVKFPKEREDAMRKHGQRLREVALAGLSPKDQGSLWAIMSMLRDHSPKPKISRIIGEFLIGMANESDKQDKIYGTDTNDENQMVLAVKKQ